MSENDGTYVVPFNGSADVADAYTANVTDFGIFYESGHLSWVIASSALVLLMIPGVGFFYSGLARRKSALSLIHLSMLSVAVISFEWFFWGYSLTFSHTGSVFIGDMANFGLRNTNAYPSVGSSRIPDILFCLFQGMFAAITPALAIGAVADRGRMLPAGVFIFIWGTIVYNPIAYWAWNANGWLFALGYLDFAGGSPVHLNSGIAALAYCLMLGRRSGYDKHHGLPYRPHNVTHVVLGTVFLWVGWFGFNGGSALGANVRAIMACVVTNLAASVGGITWCLLDYRLEKKWSTIGFCSGAISGLVAITPGSGFVTPWASVVFGVVAGVACNFATKLKFLMGVDDALDVFAVHAVGGTVGNLLTGLFAAPYIADLDGSAPIGGGWIVRHWMQIPYQLAGTAATIGWCFTVTCIILFVMNLIPGMQLRTTEVDEDLGLDDCELGEFAYDYVELTRNHEDILIHENGSHPGPSPVEKPT